MAHAYILTRGIKHDIDRMINDLQAQYYPYEIQGKTMALQLSVRPIQLWELVMPEPCLQDVMRLFWINQEQIDGGRFKPQLMALRKLLKANKYPPLDLSRPMRLIYKDNCAVYPIGIRIDEKDVNDGHEMI